MCHLKLMIPSAGDWPYLFGVWVVGILPTSIFFSVHIKFAPATGFSEVYPTSECHETTEEAYCNTAYNDQALVTT